jgi:16S rRNA (guanine966-N2)-methyltransferase
LKTGVRIAGGEFRGRPLAVPPQARPTEGRVREALFSIWQERVGGARLLDLFSGSGVVALEALGRGALETVCVDQSPQALRTLQENAARLGVSVHGRRLTLPEGLDRLRESGPFDLIFVDPPYAFPDYLGLLAGIAPLLRPEGEVAVEHASRTELPAEAGPLVRVGARSYGESALGFYRRLY